MLLELTSGWSIPEIFILMCCVGITLIIALQILIMLDILKEIKKIKREKDNKTKS